MKRFISLIGIVAAVGFVGMGAQAAELFWDGDGASPQGGGAGVWDTTLAKFSTTAGGTVDQIWNNANVDSARMTAAAGAVTLAGPITVNVITTDVSGYAIGNGNGVGTALNRLTFSGADAGINTLHTSGTTALSAQVDGILTKTGPGRLEINNSANLNTSKYVLKGGAMTAPNSNRYGPLPGALVSDFFTLDGGGLGFNTTTSGIDLGATRGITIGANNGFLSTSNAGVIVTVSAPIVGTAGGDLTVGGNPSVWVGTAHNVGGIWILTNTGNSWDGDLTINGTNPTIVRLGTSGVVPDTAVVTLSAAGNQFDLATNNVTETVKSIAGTAGTIALGTAGVLTVDNPNGETYTSVFTGTVGSQFIKNGNGALTLTGSSTGFSGEMVLNSGTLGIGGNNALGSNALGPQLTINGGKLSNNGTGGRSLSANLSVNLNADFIADDSLFNSSTPGQIAFNGPSTIKNSDRTITVLGQANLGFVGAIGEDSPGRSLTKLGDGILALNGVNTYTGNTTLSAGRINIDGDGTLGNGDGTLNLAGGRLNITADRSPTSAPVANPINMSANTEITTTSVASEVVVNFSNSSIVATAGTLTIRNDGVDAVDPVTIDTFKPRLSGSGFNFARPMVIDNGASANARTELNLYNLGSTTQTFSGDISGTGSLRRSASLASDAGTTVLTGNNTYSGGTSVFRGTLLVNNTSGSGTGSGPVNVRGGLDTGIGSGVLGGTGTIGGPVTVELGGTLAPGASIGTLTLDGNGSANPMLTLASDAKLQFEVNNSLSADRIALINGAAGDIVFNNNVINFTDLAAGSLANGNYILFSATAANNYANLVLSGDTISTGLTIGTGLEAYAGKSLKLSGNNIVLAIGAAPANLGDFNLDGVVDARDYVIWRDTIGTQVKYDEWKANYGNIYPGSSATVGLGLASNVSAVPEPSSLVLVLLGFVAVELRARRRRR